MLRCFAVHVRRDVNQGKRAFVGRSALLLEGSLVNPIVRCVLTRIL